MEAGSFFILERPQPVLFDQVLMTNNGKAGFLTSVVDDNSDFINVLNQ